MTIPNPIITIIEIDEEIRALISPINVYIDSPSRIETTLLQPFQDRIEKVFLIVTRKGQLIPATLESIKETYLIANAQQSVSFYKTGDRVLVIFPILPDQHHVLQTWIDKIYPTKLKLRYQDPRYDVRRQFQVEAQSTLYLAPPIIITAIEQRQLHILRETVIDLKRIKEGEEGYITDALCKISSPEPSPYMELFQETPALSCSLKNISCGGACLALMGEDKPEKFLYRLVLLHITLPHMTSDTTRLEYGPLTLTLLGVIRGITTTSQPWNLHIAFLRRLSPELEPLFEHLEHCFLEK